MGIAQDDGPAEVERLAQKTAQLRIFRDDEARMNRSALEVGAAVLVISQFTLYADMRVLRAPGGRNWPSRWSRLSVCASCGVVQVACGVLRRGHGSSTTTARR